MIDVTFRPLVGWPGTLTAEAERRRSPFSATWGATLSLLDHELCQLDAAAIVVQLAVGERDIRVDGWPRASARPSHPGVILAFDSRHGPLRYSTDLFQGWHDNLRAVALGLEALRRVDRYGISRGGEQYRGWKQLEAPGRPGAPMSREQAAEFLAFHAGDVAHPRDLLHNTALQARAFRAAARTLHPDAGGSVAMFDRLQQAREVLDGGGR